MNNKLMAGLVVAGLVIVGGGVLLLRNTNPKPPEIVGQPGLQVPVAKETTAPEAKVENGLAAGRQGEVTVEGSKFKFLPATVRAKKGDTVVVMFKNNEGIHDWGIDEYDVRTNQIGEGEEEEIEFVADKTGTFEYYCSVGNHRQMGMVGKLIVE